MIERAKLDELRNLAMLLQETGMEQYESCKLVVRAVRKSAKKKISVIAALKTITGSNKKLNLIMTKIDESKLTEWESLFA